MIIDANIWKFKLNCYLPRLERRIKQRRWTDRSICLFERELEINHFSVRRLAEAEKLTDRCITKLYDCQIFKNVKQPVDDISRVEFRELFDLNRGEKASVVFNIIANQFIHGYIICPFWEEKLLSGFLVCSDIKKTKSIFFFSLKCLKQVFLDVINDEIFRIETRRNVKTGEFRKTQIS